MSKNRDWTAFFLIAALLWIGLGSYGLVEPSDARFAEIGREMWVSGDYLFPKLLGIHHFHKPPLIYWLTSLGFSTFGRNEWGARACLGILGLILGWVIWRFTRRHVAPESAPLTAIFLMTTPAVIGAGRMLSIELLLVTSQTVALTSWYEVWSGSGGRRSLATFYLAVGFTFLAKGPVPCLILLLILFPFSRRHRKYGRRSLPGWGLKWGIPLSLAIALTWFAYVVFTTHGLLEYFLGDQIMGRLRSGGMGHPHPWYYYLGVMPLLGLPWIFLAPAGFRSLKRSAPPLAEFFLYWALIPPLFFSFPATKLPLYILLSFPSLAILAGKAISSPTNGTIKAMAGTGVLFLFLGIFLFLAGVDVIPIHRGDLIAVSPDDLGRLFLPPAFVFSIGGIITALFARRSPARASLFPAIALGFFSIWVFSQGDAVPFESAKKVGTVCAEELREQDVLVEYRDLSSGLPFYAGRLPLLAGMRRETQFESPETTRRTIDEDTFRRLWTSSNRVFVVTSARHLMDLPNPKMITRGGGYVLVSNR